MQPIFNSLGSNYTLSFSLYALIQLVLLKNEKTAEKLRVFFENKFKGKATVLGITKAKIHELNDYICYLDTGYSRNETIEILQKMYPKLDFRNQYLCIILLKKIEPPKPKQETLFN